MIDIDGNVYLVEIETLRPSELLCDAVSGVGVPVETILVRETMGIWPVVQYMGLTCDLAQFVHVPHRGWVEASGMGTRCRRMCTRMYAVVASGGSKAVRVDGVICLVADDATSLL